MPKLYGGHVPGASAILTDIPAGTAIFRELAPLVGDEVRLEKPDGSTAHLSPDWTPSDADVLIIRCAEPSNPPTQFDFENRRGGSVSLRRADGSEEQIGRVVQPVRGVGRFDGTAYTGVGAVNTNHGGVITISTAPGVRPADEGTPPERRGGFEIQPVQHAATQPDMPQAMIVAPMDEAFTLEGAEPLFRGVLALGDGSSVAQVRRGSSEWEPMPEIVGKVDDAFLRPQGGEPVTELRILRPRRTQMQIAAAFRRYAPAAGAASVTEAVWTLSPPLPPNAAYIVFSSGGRSLAISNVRPYRLVLASVQDGMPLKAEIIGLDGRSLQTRTAVVRAGAATVSVQEIRK